MTPISVFCITLLLFSSGTLTVALLRSHRALRRSTSALETVQTERDQERCAMRERSELDAIKDEFISTVSHELRTPLTSIRGSLGLLSSGMMGISDPKAHNLLRIALSNTDRLIRLINDILDLERMQSGRAPLQLRRCSLPELTDIAVESISAVAEAARVQIEFVPCLSSGGLFFDGDPDRIVQVLTNLLSNAVKFSFPDSLIQIQAEANPGFIQLRIIDQGRGIPADKIDSIFDRFLQVDDDDSRQKGGTGLGLAICRTIVQQHAGSIWAERNSGAGSTFHVMLPRTTRKDDAIHPAPALPTGEGCVLICDDESAIRTIISEHLTRQGYTCLEANSGRNAIELASSHAVDAILLDLYMPGLSGWETLQHLRSHPGTAHIPVVVLSVLSPDLRREIAGDAQGWVQKPFNEHLLFAELGRVLRQNDRPAEVLLVEDDLDLATVLSASFAESDVALHHVATRQDAIRRCISHRPDLLILDLNLPDGDGFSFVAWMRRQPGLGNIPLVVYSGRDVSDRERSALRLGKTEFLTKATIATEDVGTLVRSMLRNLRHEQPSVIDLPQARAAG